MTPFSRNEIDRFIETGWLRLDDAFPRDLAKTCRDLLWQEIGLREDDPSGWTQPVMSVPYMTKLPFLQAARTERLKAAFDQLAGKRGWRALRWFGSFPIRFPSSDDPGDTGWHVDASFRPDDLPDEMSEDYSDWRVNLASKGRSLLCLFLFSDVSADDAPTRLREGSHRTLARRLAPLGPQGLTMTDQFVQGFPESEGLPERLATGPAGTVYLLHPFMVHAAQPHRGRVPRFMAQPRLIPRGEAPPPKSAVARAIRLALE